MRAPSEPFCSSSDASACSAFVTHTSHTRHGFRISLSVGGSGGDPGLACTEEPPARNRQPGTGRFAGDGTPEEAPRPAAGTAAAAARDANGRPVGRRDDPAVREPLLAVPCPGCRSRRGGLGPGRVSRSREAAACLDGGRAGGEPLVRARDRTPRRRADPAEATCGSDGVRSDHPVSRGPLARLARDPRAAAGCLLARLRRPDRPSDHPRAAPLVRPRLRTRTRRCPACGRLAGHPRSRRAADRLCDLLHAPLRGHSGSAGVGVRLRPRHLAAALPRRRAPLLRPACACRLGAPTEEAQCRRTSCCPT